MIEKYHKEIKKYCDSGFCVLVPVWYDNELTPAWRIVYKGTLEECKKEFGSYPNYMFASYEENATARKWKLKEMLFCREIGNIKRANAIKTQYGF